jgi:hypothetical protein
LQIIQQFESAESAITTIAFSYDQEYLFVSTAAGEFLIFVIHAQGQ